MSKNPGVPPIDGQDSEAENRHVVKQEEAFSDQFFYCEICQQPFIHECVIHGPPLFTLDSPTPLGLPQRALLTLPHGLVIGRSSLPNAGLGVFNQGQTIRLGMHFGPLDGEVTSGEKVLDQAASWIIYRGNDQCSYIDTGKDTHSNWMRFVVCSRSELEQNLVAFQQNGQIWFRCCRPINPGEEFRVWYSEEYARAVATIWDEIWKMKCTLLGQTHENGKEECQCSFCHHSFPTPFYLRLHVKRSHPDVSADASQNQMLVLDEEPHLLSSDPSQPGTESSQDPDASSQARETCNAVDVSVQCGTSLSDASDPDVLCEVNKCSQCDQNFQRSCHLKRHQRTIHSKEKPYCCSHCGKCFSQSTGLKRHQRVHQRQEESEGNAEESIQCSTSLLNKLDFSQHAKEKHLGKRLRSITAVTEEDVDKHDPPYKPSPLRQRTVKSQNGQTKKVPSGRPRGRPQKSKCVVSNKRQTESCDLSLTDSAQQMSPHLEKELEEPQNVCGECLKDFASIDLLRAHECFKSGSEFHICPHCKICFYQVSSLRRHELCAHSKEKPYCCTMCPKSFTQSSDLKRHQRIHLRRKTCRQTSALANAAIYPCTYCPFSFIGERYLHKHMRRHHPEMSMKYLSSLDGGVMSAERPHSCSQCCKSFSTIKGFKNHSCFKQGEKVYLCPDCGKAFGWLNSLKQHQRIHTGEKPYTCQQCGKSFVHSGQLNVHLRTHTGEKPFLCSQCGESFRQSGDLRRHEQKHSGVRPCQCLDCGKSFSRPQSLKAHQQLHEGTKLFPCTQCGKSFTRRYHLTRHNQKMHS